MFNLLKARIHHGYQAIRDIDKATVDPAFRGFPVISESPADGVIGKIVTVCPTAAIKEKPLAIDLGLCILCGECAVPKVEGSPVHFSNNHLLGADSAEKLVVTPGMTQTQYWERAIKPKTSLKRLFKRSLKLRSVSAGGCNACEMELNAAFNVNFDAGRFGIDIVASPRHADGLILTGPVSENMAFALEETWKAIPEPKILIVMGTCAISGGLFRDSPAVNREFLKSETPVLYLPGCPVHPLTFVSAVKRLIGWRS